MAILAHKDSEHKEVIRLLTEINEHAAIHDGQHIYFIVVPDHIKAMIPDDRLLKVESWNLSGDELAWKAATVMTANIQDVLDLDVYTGHRLFQHPAHRIWCAKYEDREQFASDWEYIRQMVIRMEPEAAALWPEYNEQMSYEDGREIIYTAITQFIGQ